MWPRPHGEDICLFEIYRPLLVLKYSILKCRFRGPVARQPLLPMQPFCPSLVAWSSSFQPLSMNLIGPPSTELLQFLTKYVTWRCDLDLWPFDLGAMYRGGATQTAAAPATLAAGLSQNQLQAGCDYLQDPQHWFTCIPESSPKPSRINTNITFVWHFTALRANHQDWAREACLPMRSSICLELTTFIHHQQRLSDNLQISAVYLLTVAYTSDLITFPPAPLKLLSYGAI